MNDTINTILTRRSIRKYKPDDLSDDTIHTIVQAGLYAPSTKGKQARHLIVVKEIDAVNKLNELVRAATQSAELPAEQQYLDKVTNPKFHISFHAPVFMITTADFETMGNPISDCAAMLENMFLAAHSVGVGSVWVNQLNPISDVKLLRAFLTESGAPETYKICGAAAFGYSAVDLPPMPPRKENLVTIINKVGE